MESDKDALDNHDGAPPKSAPKVPPKRPTAPKKPAAAEPSAIQFAAIPKGAGHRVALFGPGGIGKTSIALAAPGPVAVIDLDESLGILTPQLPGDVRENVRMIPVDDYAGIRSALHAPGWDEIQTIVIDSMTRAEELASAWVLKNVPHEKGNRVTRIEDYGFGKGYSHIFDAMLALIGDLDTHVRAGRNVVLVCHDCTTSVPNPSGEDYLRYEPRLQSPPSGKNSVRHRVTEWSDHLFFIGYDIEASDGKATGSGTRTIYPVAMPFCTAKSRTLCEVIPYERDSATLWDSLLAE